MIIHLPGCILERSAAIVQSCEIVSVSTSAANMQRASHKTALKIYSGKKSWRGVVRNSFNVGTKVRVQRTNERNQKSRVLENWSARFTKQPRDQLFSENLK
jgi:hypothetical protein